MDKQDNVTAAELTPLLMAANTFTATDITTLTITPMPSNTPTLLSCPTSLPSRLYTGMYGRVIPSGSPSILAKQIGMINPGDVSRAIGDPRCGDNYVWLQVRYQGVEGWTAESNDGDYWGRPLLGAAVFDPNVCTVSVNTVTNKRSGFGTTFASAGQLAAHDMSDVIRRNVGSDGHTWYQLSDGSWMHNNVVQTHGLCDAVPLMNL